MTIRRLFVAVGLLLAAHAVAAADSRLPDGIVSNGGKDIAQAWLTRPTQRYAHGILGDAIEAGGLAVKTRDGAVLELVLPDELVFEDRQARLRDLEHKYSRMNRLSPPPPQISGSAQNAAEKTED